MEGLFNQIRELSTEDLSILNKFVVQVFNSKKATKSVQVSAKLRVDMKVKVNSPKFTNKTFIVEKINRKNAVLKLEGTTMQYNVPFNLIITE